MTPARATELAEMFLYLEWLENAHTEEISQWAGEDLSERNLVLESDGTTCWGATYREAIKSAMEYDRKLFCSKEQCEKEDENL